ncbi:hypothetical protein IQ07DRAFT_570542 [Pyrenochaeta sp. DS3sAY3a]|nr:hypothetical protein IQ07DRAFT_570542 [Pyrenochaeta sp. DS3sAY3a]
MPPPKTVFTAHERNALKDRWGTQATRLTRDSFLPFGSCQLCLLPAVDPVCCPQGDLFCRECAMTNLLAQRKEIKRLEKESERQKLEATDATLRDEEAARLRAIEDFEAVQMGLSVKGGGAASHTDQAQDAAASTAPRKPPKRKFELDEQELARIAQADHHKARRTLTSEHAASTTHLPSFWVPAETPTAHYAPAPKSSTTPICPASDAAHPHALSLKSLTSVVFHEDTSPETGEKARTCPSCRKALSNSTKAVVAVPCGHVLCKMCVDKFLTPEHRHHRDAHEGLGGPEDTAEAEAEAQSLHCYVCDADLSGVGGVGKKRKKEKEGAVKPGLVQIRSEGTGFASGGQAMAKRQGVAFQV